MKKKSKSKAKSKVKKITELKPVATKTESLKWEPELIVSSFKTLPEGAWDECLSLITERDLSLLNEIESVIKTAKDDHVLQIVLAYMEDELLGFCVFNAWAGQTRSRAILLSVIKGMDTFDNADGTQRLVATLLVERSMQEAINLKNHATIKDLGEVFCIAKDTWAHEIIRRFGFFPCPSY